MKWGRSGRNITHMETDCCGGRWPLDHSGYVWMWMSCHKARFLAGRYSLRRVEVASHLDSRERDKGWTTKTITNLQPRLSWCQVYSEYDLWTCKHVISMAKLVISPRTAPPGYTVIAHVSIDVPSWKNRVPCRATSQQPSQGIQKWWVLWSAIWHKIADNSDNPFFNLKAQRNNPFIHWSEQQKQRACELGVSPYCICPSPLTWCNSSKNIF